ncbi:hypothetical protein [Peribacillus alkalitolerans]|uniref:hypothetical protein n=1 Tax=Peribacillus alkalitolerans TaxID=1550385 RepID=UPI0013D5226F|nr:hypothetical protein [Peribacillus alkalitolerans]
MMDISMQVNPSFFDEECAIVFSFYFKKDFMKIGEAVIYTCAEDGAYVEERNEKRECYEKVAYLKEFTIIKEYEEHSINKIEHFLHILGIKKCF